MEADGDQTLPSSCPSAAPLTFDDDQLLDAINPIHLIPYPSPSVAAQKQQTTLPASGSLGRTLAARLRNRETPHTLAD
jgi:hypothetical protein